MDLTEITNETIKLFSLNLSQKNIALEANLPPNIELTADKFMMQTILRNLLSNAIKYTHNDGKITLSASREPQSIKISIHDTGVGISPSNMEKLFRIETSYSTAGTNKEQGTGLGLILCKEFVEKHGGSIWVESSLGKGTSFHFTIPT
jgi:signal transduction histidine kinase